MGNFIKAASIDELKDGSMTKISLSNKQIAIVRLGKEYFAFDDLCTHQQCSLSEEGFIEGEAVTCGCHGGQFDMKTGKPLSLPAVVYLNTYPVKVSGADILIEL